MKRAAALALLLISAPAFSMSLNDALAHMKETESSTKDIQFNFKQDVSFTDNGLTSHNEGEAKFKKPNRIMIVQKSPREQRTISNGKKTWVYTPEFKQVWMGSTKSWVNSTAIPKGLLPVNDYVSELEKNFTLKLSSVQSDGFVSIDAQPKEQNMDYALRLTLSTKDWLPAESVYRSASAVINTKFSNYSLNAGLPDKAFEFKPPAGTDIIPF